MEEATNELDHSNRTEYSSVQLSYEQRALQGYPASHRAAVRKKRPQYSASPYREGCSCSDSLPCSQVAAPLSWGTEACTPAVAASVGKAHKNKLFWAHKENVEALKLLGFPRLSECWQEGKGAEIQIGEGPNWSLIGGEG